MKVSIILNGISRKKKFFYREIFPVLIQKFDVVVFETQHAQHGIELASAAAKEKFDFVLAAGGDGTLNQVVNGVLADSSRPAIGIIPLGTGNDFARTCGAKPDANQIAGLISQNKTRPTDVGRMVCHNEQGHRVTRYFINVCSMGMGPEVVKRLLKSDRSLGPSLTYLKAITSTFFSHRPQEIRVKTRQWEWQGKMRALAIANGKSFGNAMYIAPDASPDDGVFSTFLATDLPLLKFLLCLQQVKWKKKINDRQIIYNACTSVEITAPAPCAVEAEGEWMGWLPMTIDVLPGHLDFLR